MYKFVSTIFMALVLISTPVFAGAGHDHGHSHGPIKAEAAIAKAKSKITALVKDKKLDASWSKLEAATIDKKNFSKGPEWVITFKNEKVEDASKQTLYFFYSLDGHYIAANYTGN